MFFIAPSFFCNILHMYILTVRDVAIFGMDSRIACVPPSAPAFHHCIIVTLYTFRRSSISPAPLPRARVASSDSPLPLQLRHTLRKAIEQQQLSSDCSRLLVFSWIAPALAGHGSQLGHVLVALNFAFLNGRTLVIRSAT
jgi:hypothetical protein